MVPLIYNSIKKNRTTSKIGVKSKPKIWQKKTGSIWFKKVSRKNGLTNFGQRGFSHSQCMIVSRKEIKIGGH